MKYYLDQEFNEGFRRPIWWLPTIGSFNRKYHFIDLISIGLVCEDGREYYAVCKEFDVKAAYNKYQVEKHRNSGDSRNMSDYRYEKIYWLRNNVLKPIFFGFYNQNLINLHFTDRMSLSKMKIAVRNFGKSKEKIKYDILSFICDYKLSAEYAGIGSLDSGWEAYVRENPPVFYGYYADYDWVLFCSLFGTMMDLPKGLPMYCNDLKQVLDQYVAEIWLPESIKFMEGTAVEVTFDLALEKLKGLDDFPKQENEHHALADAKWNKKLHEFLLKL